MALATPAGVGGLGVIRLSGPKSQQILTQLWRPQGASKSGPKAASKNTPIKLKPREMRYGDLIHPQEGTLLDQVLVVFFPHPHSYTGEDVVEIHAHGAPLLLNQILEILLTLGARLAQPGEFTRLAYLNGKLDLLQAEAVAELIHAKSEAALKNARGQLAGRISHEVAGLRQRVIELLARVEAAIDFPEEDIELIQAKQSAAAIATLQATLKNWQEKFNMGRMLREGVRVALVGRPNVGKSSLLNRLLGEDKAIVHASAGTTRDVVEAWTQIGDIAFELWDTAGIRHSAADAGVGDVEALGIARSKERIQRADVRLWVVDASREFSELDQVIAQTLAGIAGPTVIAANQCDRPLQLKALPKDSSVFMEDLPWVSVSAQTGSGLSELKQALLQAAGLQAVGEQTHAYLNNTRHRLALEQAQNALKRAQQALDKTLPAECVAADLSEAAKALGTLLGKISNEDVLDKIFQEFCLGK